MAGSNSCASAMAHLAQVDGVMLGRAAYADPYLWPRSIARCSVPMRRRRRGSMCSTASCLMSRTNWRSGARLNQMTRHILGLFHGQPRARAFRRYLAENAHLDGAGIDVLLAARRIIAREERTAIAAE